MDEPVYCKGHYTHQENEEEEEEEEEEDDTSRHVFLYSAIRSDDVSALLWRDVERLWLKSQSGMVRMTIKTIRAVIRY